MKNQKICFRQLSISFTWRCVLRNEFLLDFLRMLVRQIFCHSDFSDFRHKRSFGDSYFGFVVNCCIADLYFGFVSVWPNEHHLSTLLAKFSVWKPSFLVYWNRKAFEVTLQYLHKGILIGSFTFHDDIFISIFNMFFVEFTIEKVNFHDLFLI